MNSSMKWWVLAVLAFLLFAWFLGQRPVSVFVVEASMEVSDQVGFDVNDTALTFGKVVPGTSSTRSVVIANGHAFPVVVRVDVLGGISDFVASSDEVMLAAGEERSLGMTVSVPSGAVPGVYEGVVEFVLYRAR